MFQSSESIFGGFACDLGFVFFLEYATILFLSSGPEFYFYYFVDLLDHATDQLAFRRITRTVSVSLRVSDTGACDKSRPLGDLLTLSPRGGNCPIG